MRHPSIRTRAVTLIASLATVASLLAAPFAQAGFNPDLIFDDASLRNDSSMTYAEIRAFLQQKGGLADVIDIDPVDGLVKNGAQIVADAARRYRVNPQYLLALIQKESSAVEADVPQRSQLEWATGYALCDGCFKNASLAQKYKGFAKQVDAGAGFIDWFFKEAANGTALRKVGVPYTIGSQQVVPQNVGTAALYSYTPHIHGNVLLWTIWNRWFGDGTVGMNLPDGTLARDSKTGAVALVQGGKFRVLANPSVLSTRFSGITPVNVSHDVFEGFIQARRGRDVRFSDYSLVRVEDGTIYLLVGDSKRRIVSMEAFVKTGFNPEEVEDALAEDLEGYEDGDPITTAVQSVAGELLQNNVSGGVYFVQDGTKHALLDRAVLSANFPNQPIGRVSPAYLAALPTGGPVLFDDGLLVKAAGNPAVYVISDGKRRLIPSEDVFLALGYRWPSIVTTTQKMLDLHPVGETITMAQLFSAISR